MNGIGRNIFQKYRKLIMLIVGIIRIFPKKLNLRILSLLRRKRGYSGIILRYMFLQSVAKSCGDNVVIMEDVYLYHPENISFGSNVSIHPMCYVQGSKMGIDIGDNVSIAHGTTIIAESHTYSEPNIPIKYQKMESEKIVIKSNVWIGAKCTILNGIHIESGSIIGANSVVTHHIGENEIVAGSPARTIKRRIENA